MDVHFDRAACAACQCKGRCPVKLRDAERLRDEAQPGQPRGRREPRLEREGGKRGAGYVAQRMEGSVSEWKKVQKGGRVRHRGTRKVDAANQMKLVGLNIMRFFRFRIQCERLRRLA